MASKDINGGDKERNTFDARKLLQAIKRLIEEHTEALEKLKEGAQDRRTDFEKVLDFFRATNNAPATTRAIMHETGVSRSSLSQILYKTHRDLFNPYVRDLLTGKKLWLLTQDAARKNTKEAHPPKVSPTLFGPEPDQEPDLRGLDAAQCCAQILRDHNNEPMPVLTLTREALKRGYRARTRGDEDEVLFSTAKSFWARLFRDKRFFKVRPFVYRLRLPGDPQLDQDETAETDG